MPVLDGAGLFEQIRNRWPALLGRLLFVSGSAAMPEYADFLRTAQPYILPRPFAIAHPEEAVQRMLAVRREPKPSPIRPPTIAVAPHLAILITEKLERLNNTIRRWEGR
jgi:hypothetical protein